MDITRFLVDDFLKALAKERKKKQIEDGKKPRKPTRTPGLTESEIATIVLMFQESPCRNFKYFYESYLQQYRPEFPNYGRFVALQITTYGLLSQAIPSLDVFQMKKSNKQGERYERDIESRSS